MSRRALLPTILVLAAAACSLPAAAAGGPVTELKSPSAADIARGGFIPDSILPPSSFRHLAAASSWGGTYTASTGETVTIRVSNAYEQDPARPQRWADFIAGLIHGKEISSVTVYLAPLTEVQSICGRESLACYSDAQSLLVTPGDDPASDVSAEAVVTHEYGHHVAANRANLPWPAIDYGTKRWATAQNVCARTRTGELHPGAEDFRYYTLNPGEAFAESYRMLNERRHGLPETPWEVVSPSLYPSDAAISALEQDVVSPWQGTTIAKLTGTLARAGTRSYTVSTPLDGTLKATVRAPAKGKVAVSIVIGSAALGRATTTAGASATATATVCGHRSATVRVTAPSGSGSFQVTLSKP